MSVKDILRNFLCFTLPENLFVKTVLPALAFFIQGSFVNLKSVKKTSYDLHIRSSVVEDFVIKRMSHDALLVFLSRLFLERNMATTALKSPVVTQGARDLADQPVSGSALLFSFDNDQSSTSVSVARQRIPAAGLLNSKKIFFVETANVCKVPYNCHGLIIAYCSSCKLKCNEYNQALECDWNLGAILSHSSNLTIIKRIRSIIVSKILRLIDANTYTILSFLFTQLSYYLSLFSLSSNHVRKKVNVDLDLTIVIQSCFAILMRSASVI